MLETFQSKNILPRSNRSGDYKVWQKLAITRAGQAMVESKGT